MNDQILEYAREDLTDAMGGLMIVTETTQGRPVDVDHDGSKWTFILQMTVAEVIAEASPMILLATDQFEDAAKFLAGLYVVEGA